MDMDDILIWIFQAFLCAPVLYVCTQLHKSKRWK
nr:MAG TPA: hypothetical protein [Caudoviricetes sp.]